MSSLMAHSRIAFVAAAAVAIVAGSAQSQTEVREYLGMCEASAAVAVGPDHFLVADDEDSVGLYERSKPAPVWVEKAKKAFGVDVTDVEAAAAIGDRVYWLTSHSRNRKGNDKDERRVFFATDIVGQGSQATLKPAGKPYTRLRDDLASAKELQAYDLAAAAARGPEELGGFNIEGLAATPEKKLLIGFRNPIPGGRTLVVQLENPDEVIMQGAKPRFGEAIELDLDGFGIRSIERVSNGYLIAAGAYRDCPCFTLRLWSGSRGERPRILPQPALANSELALVPEALFAIPGTNNVQILSDDGDFWARKNADKECDKTVPPEQKKFRSITVTIAP